MLKGINSIQWRENLRRTKVTDVPRKKLASTFLKGPGHETLRSCPQLENRIQDSYVQCGILDWILDQNEVI